MTRIEFKIIDKNVNFIWYKFEKQGRAHPFASSFVTHEVQLKVIKSEEAITWGRRKQKLRESD